VTVDYLDLVDYLAIAAAVTSLDEQTVVRIVDIGLADSALHAPAAGTGAQLPNAPLLTAFAAWLVATATHGSVHAYAGLRGHQGRLGTA
jgi:hypothetical protein